MHKNPTSIVYSPQRVILGTPVMQIQIACRANASHFITRSDQTDTQSVGRVGFTLLWTRLCLVKAMRWFCLWLESRLLPGTKSTEHDIWLYSHEYLTRYHCCQCNLSGYTFNIQDQLDTRPAQLTSWLCTITQKRQYNTFPGLPTTNCYKSASRTKTSQVLYSITI